MERVFRPGRCSTQRPQVLTNRRTAPCSAGDKTNKSAILVTFNERNMRAFLSDDKREGADMHLTIVQRKLVEEIEFIAATGRLDWRKVEEWYPPKKRLGQLRRIKEDLIRAKITFDYVWVDNMLSDIIDKYFCDSIVKNKRKEARRLFSHFIIEEMYVIRKLALVEEIYSIDKNISKRIRILNDIRNALTHSLYPERRRAWHKEETIIYKNKDIYTIAGISVFHNEMMEVHAYLHRLAYNAELFSPETEELNGTT